MRVIITGTTGMVGEGVLLECLSNPQVSEILSVSRKPTGITHSKLKEYIVADFLSLKENDENLVDYDACFFCAGVSSLEVKEPEYTRITYDTTMNFANAIHPKSKLSFIYVSGAGTDGSEKGRIEWARVKGKTENDLMKLPFKQAFAFRPGFMKVVAGQKYIPKWYKYVSWLFPIFNFFSHGTVTTLHQVGKAMIFASQCGYEKSVLKNKDIVILEKKYRNV
jgi:uncharacterized protein YbjT (DUF2867 family)